MRVGFVLNYHFALNNYASLYAKIKGPSAKTLN